MTVANHHYVPQFILRNFVDRRTGKIAAFDKTTGRVSHVGVRNAAQSPNFNAQSDGDDELEQLFGDIENEAARAVRHVVSDSNPNALSESPSASLLKLLVLQTFRNPRQRRINTLMAASSPWLVELGELRFAESGQLEADSQLRVISSYLRMWTNLGPSRWRLGVLVVEDDTTEAHFVIPDNGCVVFHPQLRTDGWVDASLNEMSSLVMPVSPSRALFAANPAFHPSDGGAFDDRVHRCCLQHRGPVHLRRAQHPNARPPLSYAHANVPGRRCTVSLMPSPTGRRKPGAHSQPNCPGCPRRVRSLLSV